MRIALIKTSSLGDVIHTLPVVSDIAKAHPGAQIIWVVEEGFAAIPEMVPQVSEVIKVAIRRWRKSWKASRSERQAVWEHLGAKPFDAVVDLQGLLKSAWVSSKLRGPRYGYSWTSAREPLASLSYQHRYTVPWSLHAVERSRQLASLALGYKVDGPPCFGLKPQTGGALDADLDRWMALGPFIVGLHATARPEKLWPVAHWHGLLDALGEHGWRVLMPWGSQAERAAADALGRGRDYVVVAPRLDLKALAATIARADAVVGVDTGLTHLAAALGTPTVAVFGATEAWRYGPVWAPQARSLGGPGAWPSAAEVLRAMDELVP